MIITIVIVEYVLHNKAQLRNGRPPGADGPR